MPYFNIDLKQSKTPLCDAHQNLLLSPKMNTSWVYWLVGGTYFTFLQPSLITNILFSLHEDNATENACAPCSGAFPQSIMSGMLFGSTVALQANSRNLQNKDLLTSLFGTNCSLSRGNWIVSKSRLCCWRHQCCALTAVACAQPR